MRREIQDEDVRLSIGSLSLEAAEALLPTFHTAHNVNLNIELAHTEITARHVELLFQIIKGNAANTFNFTYLFNSVPTPYFPSAIYRENGSAVGLQPTDLSADCTSLQDWLNVLKGVWEEIAQLMLLPLLLRRVCVPRQQ